MKTIYVSKPIPVFDPFLAVAACLRWINRNHDDYGFRLDNLMLTSREAKAYVRKEIADKQQHERDGALWSGIWHEGG